MCGFSETYIQKDMLFLTTAHAAKCSIIFSSRNKLIIFFNNFHVISTFQCPKSLLVLKAYGRECAHINWQVPVITWVFLCVHVDGTCEWNSQQLTECIAHVLLLDWLQEGISLPFFQCCLDGMNHSSSWMRGVLGAHLLLFTHIFWMFGQAWGPTAKTRSWAFLGWAIAPD